MLIRSSRLPKNQSPGFLDEKPLRTVHQRPPKNITPRKKPATIAGTRRKVSFITILLFLSHCLVFLGHPMPGIQTAETQAHNQQHQRPGMASRMAIVQPDTKRRAEQCRNHHRPADKPHHAQAKPDTLRNVALRLELTFYLRRDFPAERCLIFRCS